MNIVICEDSESDLLRLQDCIAAAVNEMDIDAGLSCFNSGEELLSAISAGLTPTVCFLDIYMPGITGAQAAREIKLRHPGCAVVFVTSSPDHMGDGFEIGAVHYLLKPAEKAPVETALRRALSVTGYESRYVELTVNRQLQRVLLSDIIYAETQARYCLVYLKSRTEPLRIYLKMDELEALLSNRRFLRCHHSFIVNLDEVAAPTESSGFLLRSGAVVPIRQRSRREVILAYNDYYFERLRRGGL